ncbi:MAG TPA: adenylate/guanylate cyclase domain-containing protein [Gaiellaceae bacterium]|nr:adenylate/guanylate cyclase domain-containing protein [Gaiellaceae bacterium]
MVCAACGSENPDGFRFCGSCGAALAPAEARREVRKVVTVLFCDLSGSTELGDRTDPETLRRTMRSYYEASRAILERHGGTVEKFVGDAVMAVFGVPVAHEDDALRAVRAAWELRAAVPALGLAARIGVNTGEVVAGEGDTLVTGDAVNIAARLEQGAAPGEVLVGVETRRHVRDAVVGEAVTVDAKGKGAVQAFRLSEVDPAAPAVARRLDAPLVGRARELQLLRQAAERSVQESACHLFTLLGTAGIGKSRLTEEFLSAADATVIRGRCLHYGEGITFWPVLGALKQLGPRAEPTIERIVAGASSPNELFLAIRRQLEEVAREGPLVVVFDDIHWGEQTFFDLIDNVTDLSRGAPMLLLCLARPELLDERPGWAGGKLNATTLLLEPLTREECQQLVEALDGDVDPTTRARILQSADGNPLFAEEMLALARDGGDIAVPSTIHALLQARLDRLGSDERAVIERGAVEGQVFHQSAVRELAPAAVRDGVEANLAGLVRKELIRPDRAQIVGDEAFRFRHLLVRDAAYESLPKETRSTLHERFADWLRGHAELVELDEIVGYHLEQAAGYRRELGQDDGGVALRAGELLARAGHGALGRSDVHAAVNLLDRALVLLPEGDERAWASLDRARAAHAEGDMERARAALDELTSSANPSVRIHARMEALAVRLDANPQGAAIDARALLREILPALERDRDDAGLARAWVLEAHALFALSRAGETVRAARHGLDHARRVQDVRQIAEAAYLLCGAAVWGPPNQDEQAAIADELDALSEEYGVVSACAEVVRGYSATARGDFAIAQVHFERLEAGALSLGEEVFRLAMATHGLLMALYEGRVDVAVERGEANYRALLAVGAVGYASTAAVQLAEALYLSGRPGEAERLAIEGEAMGGEDDIINIVTGRAVRARIAADAGDLATAERLAGEAVAAAERTELPVAQGDAYLALAHVERARGRPDAERAALERGLAVYQAKGDLVKTQRAEQLLAAL